MNSSTKKPIQTSFQKSFRCIISKDLELKCTYTWYFKGLFHRCYFASVFEFWRIFFFFYLSTSEALSVTSFREKTVTIDSKFWVLFPKIEHVTFPLWGRSDCNELPGRLYYNSKDANLNGCKFFHKSSKDQFPDIEIVMKVIVRCVNKRSKWYVRVLTNPWRTHAPEPCEKHIETHR